MPKHYIAGYYVIKIKPMEYTDDENNNVSTMSSCINLAVFDDCCLSWANEFDEEAKLELKLTDQKIKDIHTWSDKQLLGLGNTLPTLEMAKEFKNLFFSEREDIQIYSMSFPESDAEKILIDFVDDDFVIKNNLLKKIEDSSEENKVILGYDFIGLVGDGNFHSFHCHSITKEIEEKFSIKLNCYGLFDELNDSDAIRAYLNDPTTPVEPLPWYIARVKLIK